MDTHEHGAEKLIVGHGPLAAFLTDQGFPISKSTISKICSPAIDAGPPVQAYWGRWPAFSPSRALAWGRARLKSVNDARSRPAVISDAGRAAVKGPDDRSPGAGSSAREPLQPKAKQTSAPARTATLTRGQDERLVGRLEISDSARTPRRRQLARHLHQRGARPVLDALLAVAAGQSLDAVLEDYGRLAPEIYRALGADELSVERGTVIERDGP
jgi:hypothetical protein